MRTCTTKLSELYKFARNKSPYYRDLYQSLNDNDNDYDFNVFFKKIPFADSKMYLEPKEKLITNLDSEYYVFTSGGTTSSPKFIYLTADELHNNIRYHGFAYKQAGIKGDDRVGTFGLPGFLTSEFTVYLGLEECECSIIPIGICDYPYITECIKRFGINTLLVMPTDLINYINYLKNNDISITIPKIITGGEPLYPSVKDYISRELNTVEFGSTYQSMDFGTVGYQNDECEYNEYWIQSNLQYAEVIKHDGSDAKEGEQGELVITNLGRKLIPLIRYKTGDLVTLVCKEPLMKIRFDGRISNIIKLGGEKIEFDILNKYLSQSTDYTGKYQVLISKLNNKDFVEILIECNCSKNKRIEKMKDDIKNFVLNSSSKLNQLIESKSINEIDISIECENSKRFIYSSGSGKIKMIVDLRK